MWPEQSVLSQQSCFRGSLGCAEDGPVPATSASATHSFSNSRLPNFSESLLASISSIIVAVASGCPARWAITFPLQSEPRCGRLARDQAIRWLESAWVVVAPALSTHECSISVVQPIFSGIDPIVLLARGVLRDMLLEQLYRAPRGAIQSVDYLASYRRSLKEHLVNGHRFV